MKDEQKLNINEMANDYLRTGDDFVFTDLYTSLSEVYRDKLRYWSTSTYMANEHDITGLFHDVIQKVLNSLRNNAGGDFVKLFAVSLGNSYKSFLRKLRTRRKYELYDGPDSDEEENTAMFETIADEFDLEEHVTKKKEADQRKLIDFLTDPGQVSDETTTAIVESFITNDGPTTPTAIGKKLGLHHSTVIRKIERLAKRFDERQFGKYQDYLLAQ
ncbi:MarR family transcriptional regulator [Bacillus wiedmannii]|uniref:AsnC family protein n=1 Tax=Bacillus wiedmannii TaxID=1890302 RepID=UPI000BEB6527|nr:AsnC family protein [Bacillus wiedmannii]PEC58421.1 MarR family transcriptional regulator [Bacillus wiedmannii]PEI34192.1 MarR family transcriptional regulator [Bacillus wiedmannii]PEN91909.1 MarR family transcriptional regulator [Bacillus wiedmannii]